MTGTPQGGKRFGAEHHVEIVLLQIAELLIGIGSADHQFWVVLLDAPADQVGSRHAEVADHAAAGAEFLRVLLQQSGQFLVDLGAAQIQRIGNFL